MKTSSCAVLFMFVLTSCAPAYDVYYSPSAIGGELVKWGPNIIGPSNAIILKNDGFELKVRYTDALELELFVPNGHSLNMTVAEIHYIQGATGVERKYPVTFFEFGMPGKIVTSFEGKSRRNIFQRDGSVYVARIDIGAVKETFKIRLPTFRDGPNKVEFNDVVFKRETGMAISPIN